MVVYYVSPVRELLYAVFHPNCVIKNASNPKTLNTWRTEANHEVYVWPHLCSQKKYTFYTNKKLYLKRTTNFVAFKSQEMVGKRESLPLFWNHMLSEKRT